MRPPSRTLTHALALALLVLPASGRSGEDGPALERALATIEADELRADVGFFACQEMAGRDTPSLEQRVAARFLRARLERLGLEPGAGDGWFHEYAIHQLRIDPEGSALTLAGPGGEAALRFGFDYWLPTSRDIAALDVAAGAVWCGAGEREDLEAAEVEGRWAVCVAGEMSERRRARNAERAGAVGVIVLPDPAGRANPLGALCERVTSYALQGVVYREEREADVFPQTYLSLAAARRLLAFAGLDAPPAVGTELALQVRDLRVGSGPVVLENVCALWPGSDPELADEVIILSAHYDHVGVTDGVVYPGADDNASGSMGLLALAEALTEYGPMRRSVLLMWVSGEEKGLWGSDAWTEDPLLPPGARPVCDINIDMIGRNAPDELMITPTRALKEYNGLTRLAEELAPQEGFARLGSADQYWRRSDHMNFAEDLGIPVAFLFADVHEDYHKPGDTPDKLDYDKMRRVTRLVLRMLDRLQQDVLEL